jgi:hypothetical protein
MSDVDIEISSCKTIGFIENLKSYYIKEISQIDQDSPQQKFSEDLKKPDEFTFFT